MNVSTTRLSPGYSRRSEAPSAGFPTSSAPTRFEKALIELAREANRNQLRVADAQFEALRRAGAEDAEIVEVLGVMEVFTSFNKFLGTLQVDIDF